MCIEQEKRKKGISFQLKIKSYPDVIRIINYITRILIIIFFLISTNSIATDNVEKGGDSQQMSFSVYNGKPFSRWLGGTFVAIVGYSVLRCPVFDNFIPGTGREVYEFVLMYTVFLGSLIIACMSLFMLFKWKDKASIIIPMVAPLWIKFSTGYAEYYPYIAGLYLLFLGLLIHENIKEYSPTTVSLFCVLLALSYIAYLPLSIYFLGYYIIINRKKGVKALYQSILFAILFVSVMWPGTVYHYINQLWRDMNFIDGTIFKGLTYTHFVAVLKHFLQNVGIVGYGTLIIGLIVLFFARFKSKKKLLVLAPVVLWQLYYSFFMNPLKGIEKDRDLFFMGYITVSFLVGLMLDNINWEGILNKIRKGKSN